MTNVSYHEQDIQSMLQTPESMFKKMVNAAVGQVIFEQECVKEMFAYWIRLAIEEEWQTAFESIFITNKHQPVIELPNFFDQHDVNELRSMAKPVLQYQILYNQYCQIVSAIDELDRDIADRTKTFSVELENAIKAVLLLQSHQLRGVIDAKLPVTKPNPYQVNAFKNHIKQEVAKLASEHAKTTFNQHRPVLAKPILPVAASQPMPKAISPTPKPCVDFAANVVPKLQARIHNSPILAGLCPANTARQQLLHHHFFHQNQPCYHSFQEMFLMHHQRAYLALQRQMLAEQMQRILETQQQQYHCMPQHYFEIQ